MLLFSNLVEGISKFGIILVSKGFGFAVLYLACVNTNARMDLYQLLIKTHINLNTFINLSNKTDPYDFEP
jgi:hypothetical protein